jgi:hypothetical protein
MQKPLRDERHLIEFLLKILPLSKTILDVQAAHAVDMTIIEASKKFAWLLTVNI